MFTHKHKFLTLQTISLFFKTSFSCVCCVKSVHSNVHLKPTQCDHQHSAIYSQGTPEGLYNELKADSA